MTGAEASMSTSSPRRGYLTDLSVDGGPRRRIDRERCIDQRAARPTGSIGLPGHQGCAPRPDAQSRCCSLPTEFGSTPCFQGGRGETSNAATAVARERTSTPLSSRRWAGWRLRKRSARRSCSCCPRSSFTTGAELAVDGGYSAMGPEATGQAQLKVPVISSDGGSATQG